MMTAAQYFEDEQLEFDLPDRLRKALRIGEISAQEMAEYLGVHRTSVSSWLTGRTGPKLGMLRLWAQFCGVPFEWLRDGEAAVPELDRVRRVLLSPLDSNQQPSDYRSLALGRAA